MDEEVAERVSEELRRSDYQSVDVQAKAQFADEHEGAVVEDVDEGTE